MNFRQVRKKIRVVNNVKKITKAMEMVAAIKMRKAQKLAKEGVDYRQILEEVIKRVVKNIDPSSSVILQKSQLKTAARQSKDLYIFISSNKGLCGSFNFDLFKFSISVIDFKKSDFITIGKKGVHFILRMGGTIIADFSSQVPFVDNVSAIFSIILKNFLEEKYQQVFLVYNQFISLFSFQAVKKQILPVTDLEQLPLKTQEGKTTVFQREYLVEPSPGEIIDALIKDYLQDKIRSAILDSEAAEYSSRMLAMRNATESATDIIYNLTLLRNKLRQEAITYELLDMISAKAATEYVRG